MSFSNEHVFDLLRKIGQGDEGAFRTLYEGYSRYIYAYAIRQLKDPDAAEQIVIDTMVKVWEQPDRFRGESKFDAWVMGIARHLVIDEIRKRNRHSKLIQPPAATLDNDVDDDLVQDLIDNAVDDNSKSAADTIAEKQLQQAISGCKENLSNRFGVHFNGQDMTVLDLVYNLDMSIGEMSKLLNRNINALKTQVFEARKILKNCLKKSGIDITWFLDY